MFETYLKTFNTYREALRVWRDNIRADLNKYGMIKKKWVNLNQDVDY